MTQPGGGDLTLTTSLHGMAPDARRGIVRVHPAVLTALGARPWDVLRLQGAHLTGALVALAPEDAPRLDLACDELLLANLGLVNERPVQVRRMESYVAQQVVLTGAPELVGAVAPETLRLALLGKVVTRGDSVSLLPQDLALPDGFSAAQQDQARRALAIQVGPMWTSLVLRVVDGPEEPGIVTTESNVAWADGPSSGGSTAPRGVRLAPLPAAPTSRLGVWVPGAQSATPPSPATMRPSLGTPAMGDIPVTVTAAPAAEAPPAEDLPGLETQSASLTEWLDVDFHRSDLLRRLGAVPQTGVLLGGPAGSGKVSMVRRIAGNLGAGIVQVWCPALAAADPQVAASRLRQAMTQAKERPPCVVLLEDIEAIWPRGDMAPLKSLLQEEIRAAVATQGVAVVCTTSSPELVDPAIRHPGLLDHELSVALPDRATRRRLLDVIMRPLALDPDVHLDDVAARTPGFVAADLAHLGREAALAAAMRLGAPKPAVHETPPPATSDLTVKAVGDAPTTITMADLLSALERVRPTSMAESSLQIAHLTLDDVGDMVEVKQALTEAVLWPLQYPDTFSRLGIDPPRGLLLYGPPGCGKTYLVRAVAGSGEANVISVKGAELLSKWVGDSEAAVRELFRRARQAAPTLIFLDEVDALAPIRGGGSDSGVTDRVVASLLTELDGLASLRDVVVVGATNRPDRIDPALLRPGRLERMVFVPPPDAEARAAILRASSRKVPLDKDVDLDELAATTEGYSSADLSALVREAALTAMRASMSAGTVTAADMAAARRTVRPSLDPAQVAALAAFADEQAARVTP